VVTERVRAEAEIAELLPLMRAYCDFYDSHPSDGALLAIARALIADSEREGMQFLARHQAGAAAVGFTTLYWSWETNRGGRIGVMNDLFVAPEHRGSGAAEALIAACAEACRRRGALELTWQTGLDNHRAQAVYDRVGGRQSRWLDYSLEL
jgi:GNAT superfamily N-acetyltransferase